MYINIDIANIIQPETPNTIHISISHNNLNLPDPFGLLREIADICSVGAAIVNWFISYCSIPNVCVYAFELLIDQIFGVDVWLK